MSRKNPHFPNAPAVFEAAERFKQRCLLDQKSLLLDIEEKLWTPQHFQALIDHYVKQPDVGDGNFYGKLAGQLANCEPLDVALMAEVFWIVQLATSNLRPDTKLQRLRQIWDIRPAATFPDRSSFLTRDILVGLGSAGTGYSLYAWMEMVFAVEAFAAFVGLDRLERERLLANPWDFAHWLDGIPSGQGRQFYHVLCHVLFPDSFERVFSQSNKYAVARHHEIWVHAFGEDRPALDAALLELRHRLEAQYPDQVVDYYEEPVATLLQQQAAAAAVTVTGAMGQVGPQVAMEPQAPYSAVPDDDAKPALRQTNNLVFYGPPGTGKTHAMQRLMREAFKRGEDFTFVAFHPSYSYEDFIGGLRPVAAEGGGIEVKFQKGPFLELCEKAHANTTQWFTLFIDEINRANVAKVFGELITLIEPSKRVIAGSPPKENGAWVKVPGYERLLGVPDNLNLVATMNTADRSVALIDVALRRRFRFEECPPEPSNIEPAMVGAIHLPTLLQRLNDRLEYLLDRDHAIGHAVFMNIQSLDALRDVLARRVIPLLQEYFFEDVDKVRLALTGSSRESVFFEQRLLKPAELFPGALQVVGTAVRSTFKVTDPATWTENDILALYGGAPAGGSGPGDEGPEPQAAA